MGRTVGSVRGCRLAAAAVALVVACLPALAAQRSRSHADERVPAVTDARKPEGPLQVIVSIDRQTLRLYDKDGLVDSSTISTGTGGFPTPTGIFAILEKDREHYSNIYGGASMPFMQRLTMSGVALHSGVVTGRPASHGCVRLPHAFAIKLFALTKLGARVVIADEEVAPVSIVHPRLFKPKHPQVAAVSGLGATFPETVAAETGPAAVAASLAAEFQRAVARAKVGEASADREKELQALPVSVFVSRATGRVYVRHGFLPLLDAPAEIRDGERAIGTHVYTAMALGDEGMRWNAVSIPQVAGQSSATGALDRLELPADVVERIAGMLTPGASLIVSDQGPSREMRTWGTDFIILTQ